MNVEFHKDICDCGKVEEKCDVRNKINDQLMQMAVKMNNWEQKGSQGNILIQL
jgi:hypothetical protein